MRSPVPSPLHDADESRLPIGPLLALSSAAFLGIVTESLPAGILPLMSGDLGVSESAAGQTVTIFALGCILAAIPLTAATTGWPRKRVLLVALLGFVVANTVTAVSPSYVLTMASRFGGGVAAGLLWALMAGYARRMVAPHQRGRATAIALAGTPVALSLGVPAGVFLADLVGWRTTVGGVSALTVALIAWVVVVMPDFPGSARESRPSLTGTLRLPGVMAVLASALAFVVAHNVLYTYVAPFLSGAGLSRHVGTVLLVFGSSAVVGIWVAGVVIDRHLRTLVLAIVGGFAVASVGLAVLGDVPGVVFGSAVLWGLAFGGAAPALQTAAAEAGGDDVVDVVQSLLVTTWNLGIAGGALLGGLLLTADTSALAWGAFALLIVALAITAAAREHAFPRRAGAR